MFGSKREMEDLWERRETSTGSEGGREDGGSKHTERKREISWMTFVTRGRRGKYKKGKNLGRKEQKA